MRPSMPIAVGSRPASAAAVALTARASSRSGPAPTPGTHPSATPAHGPRSGVVGNNPVEGGRFVGGRGERVHASPTGVEGWIGAENVIVEHHMPVAEFLDAPDVRPDGVDVGRQFRLWIDDADLHG